jgi:hypothetical protein
MTRFNEVFPIARWLCAALVAATAAGCGTAGPENTIGEVSQAASTTVVAGLSLSAATVTAGDSFTGTVTLSGSAGSSVVLRIGFESAIFAGPTFVRVPSGASSATFMLATNPFLAAPASATITVNIASPQPFTSASQAISVEPAPVPPATAPPQVASLTLSPATVSSGTAVTGTVTLTDPAPAVGAVVQLANPNDSWNFDAEPPAVVVVPAGATSATFTVQTHLSNTVATSVSDIIVGNYFGGTFQGQALTITR